ncbi:hypothetical protein PCANC_19240 [Puccinia coronata f. sp. avenae]|uniref:DUF4218 domain-containing protein n=1 Tax=Puccinia coronata f. sp. avenae TaxID=200324 RepID=A0A2N5U9V8_9BASI|nr:hypothetical protein PCANC_19240 [Puccinia coronata f. sp. avenae]
MALGARAVCTCTSHGCSTQTYSENGVIKHGQRIAPTARTAHRLQDQRNNLMVQSAAAISGFRQPAPAPSDPSPQSVVNDTDLLESFADLSLSLNARLSASNSKTRLDSSTEDFDDEPNVEHLENMPHYYDCSRFHLDFINKNPAELLVNLKTSLFYVTQQISLTASAYLLRLDCQLIELVATHGLDQTSQPRVLTYSERKTLDSFPRDPATIIRHLAIDPDLHFLLCCPRCFAMYPILAAPEQCVHSKFPKPGEHLDEFKNQSDNDEDPGSSTERDSSHADEDHHQLCGATLFYKCRRTRQPIRRFAFHSLNSWLARFFSRPGIEDVLEETANASCLPFNDMADMSDIHHSRLWKEFLGPNGEQFSAHSGNLIFGMFVDGINPYGNRQAGKHASVTFMILVCLSLPVGLRYLPENVFLLKLLWNPGVYLSQTCQHPEGRLIRAALLPFFADLPALRRSLGFAGHNAKRMCSYCLIDKKDIKNFNKQTWPLRNLVDHRYWANQSREAPNAKAKKQILSDHGVRYSVLLELSYWNIVDYHVVDAMHNLLLGIFKWHCQRFWLMSDVADEEEPPPVSSRELDQLLKDSLKSTIPEPERSSTPFPEESELGIPFAEMLFGSNTGTSDTEFELGKDWDGEWIPPSTGQVILDKDSLSAINRHFKKLHIPSWIGRAIPALGKASFGRLKADEWRNLFLIQLPLVLPAVWEDGDLANQSLLENFAHLVSFVNIALKQTINKELIDKYRYHLQEYMKSSMLLFPDSPVAPNHHMAFHLPDGLENLGPCRAWWSFSMERMMGTVLKATRNNILGQMEITCLTNFYRIGNIRALLDNPNFPATVTPFIREVKSLYNPIPSTHHTQTKNRMNLDDHLFKGLIARMNEMFPLVNRTWISSDKWDRIKSRNSNKFAPLNSRVLKIPNLVNDKIVFSSVATSQNNCVVALKPNTHGLNFGIIELIFQHSRIDSLDKEASTDTWLSIKPLIPAPLSVGRLYRQLEKYDQLGVTLRKIDKSSTSSIIHSTEILSHCAWTRYKPKSLAEKNTNQSTRKTDEEYIALVCLDR